MAYPGQPLKQVAMQADQFIRYKCGKGECGTCEVNIDGKWVRTCSATVPHLDVTQTLQITVKPSMVAPTKKSSRFFSFTSFIAGFKNNLLGMVGFVREGRKSKGAFDERMQREQKIRELAAAKRAERDASSG